MAIIMGSYMRVVSMCLIIGVIVTGSYAAHAASVIGITASELLNSGYLVVTILALFILFLMMIVRVLYKQNLSLTTRLLDVQERSLIALNKLDHTIELLSSKLARM